MNNKILSVVLVAGIATTGFAGISAASTGSIDFGNKSEIRELFQKVESGEVLTADEQALLDTAKTMKGEKGAQFGGKRKGGGNLTDEEKTALEAMSDEEKQAFFDTKKAEMNLQKEVSKAVVDKLIAGESLTADEEATRLEMISKMEDDTHPRREGGNVVAKLLAGDELTADEQTELADMQVKHAEREAQKAIVQPIMEKLKAGETLSDEETQILEDNKSERGDGKMQGQKGGNSMISGTEQGEKQVRGGNGKQRGNPNDIEDDIETDENM